MIYGLYKRIGFFYKEGFGSAKMSIFYWLEEKSDSVSYYSEHKRVWEEVLGSPEEWRHGATPPITPSCPLEFLVLTGHHFEAPR